MHRQWDSAHHGLTAWVGVDRGACALSITPIEYVGAEDNDGRREIVSRVQVLWFYLGIKFGWYTEPLCTVCGEYEEDHVYTNWRACGHYTRK